MQRELILTDRAAIVGTAVDAAVKLMEISDMGLKEARELFEYKFINGFLTRHNGNKSATARAIHMHRNSLSRRLKDLEKRGAHLYKKPSGRAGVARLPIAKAARAGA